MRGSVLPSIRGREILKTVEIRLFLITFVSIFFASHIVATPDRLISFEIRDQFDQRYTDKSFSSVFLVFLGGDRKGRRLCKTWREGFSEKLGKHGLMDKTDIVEVADLRTVPWLLRSFVSSMFGM